MSITSQEFLSFRTWLRARSGIALEDGKEYLVENRLAPIVRDRDTSLAEVLRSATRDGALGELVVDAMTTNETSWFRDVHPFEALRTEVLPAIVARNAGPRRLSILSGACSTGQEAYSIAMLLRTHFPQLVDWQVRIDGFDLSASAVARAHAAAYTQLEVERGLPATMLRWFRQQGREFVVADEVRAWTRFQQQNMLEPWSMRGPYDLALLRNVLIYFDVPTKQGILDTLVEVTRPGGYVLLGSSETTINVDVALEAERIGRTTVFRTPDPRRDAPSPSPAMTSTG